MAEASVANTAAAIPRLVAGQDTSVLALSPAEGFLLSRIDGATPWRVLREIGGLSADEVDMCLEAWVAQGLVELLPPKPEKKRPAAARTPPTRAATQRGPVAPAVPELSALDESIDLEIDTQKRILEFETRLGLSYHEILGIDHDADAKAVKKAYFALSKEFHPDRYFRRQIGSFSKRLERIFKRVLEAYELLSDPAVRAEVEKSMSAAAAEGPPQQPVALEPGAPPPPPRPMTKLERLRARMPFKLPESLLVTRRNRAGEFWDSAQRNIKIGAFIEAASQIRLSIAFDPFNDEYREAFGDVQARAAEMKAEKLVAEAEAKAESGMGDEGRFRDVLRLYEEALLYRPHQPELNHKAARAAIGCKQLAKAEEYAARAAEHSPEVARYRVTQAMVFQARGDLGHAINELQQAMKLDPKDQEASALLARMRRPTSPTAREGRR